LDQFYKVKRIEILLLFFSVLLSYCHETIKSSSTAFENQSFLLDSSLRDTIQRHTQFIPGRHSSLFKTPINVKLYSNDLLVDSIIKPDFEMMSWYDSYKDTIDLVAHVGEFETFALLVHFIKGKPIVFLYMASHEHQNYFRINITDSFSNQIEVPVTKFRLELSEIPDTIKKPIIFGFINMESADYYEKRDSLEKRLSAKMKFYFRSQYKKYNF